jgi:hypothetical protein
VEIAPRSASLVLAGWNFVLTMPYADERRARRAMVRATAARRDREIAVGEWTGVAIALVSSCLGGTAAAITRYLVGSTDPITLAILRWGIGFLCLLPVALLLNVRWPSRRDWPAVALLGLCFFGLFFVLYNIAIGFTTAAAPASRWRRCRCIPWWSERCSGSSR